MTDAGIAAFIEARCAEWQAAAEAAPEQTWTASGPYVDAAEGGILAQWRWAEDAAHAALHDPARMRGVVTAIRAIVEAHDRDAHRCPIPVVSGVTGQLWTAEEGPCWTMLKVAAIWLDHPDYGKGWQPPAAGGTTP